MITLILFFILAIVLIYLADLLLGILNVPDPARRLILVAVALVILIFSLQRLGLLAGLGL